ncbi:MAG TPA: IS30 family transposase [Candidatus Methylomirabilis sp.]|nr:IS30 family transposase [Candidatus Methylomirabilis sp.]
MHQAGVPVKRIARMMGRQNCSMRELISRTGGIRPRARVVNERHLSLAEREEISRGLAAGLSLRSIAHELGRTPSTVSREVNANGGRGGYRAVVAEGAARRRAKRPKVAKLARCRRLRAKVEAKLAQNWSPEEISGWLARTYPNDPEMYVSHETIYQSIFVQGRGALRHELHLCLRSGRAMRRNKRWVKSGHGMGKIRDMVMITERPAEAEDRAVPGHWEGDLIMGKGFTSVGTLVERTTRYLMLVRLPKGHGAEAFRDALTKRIVTLPAQLRRSITWDQGPEMSEHVRFTVDTGVQVYFCDPKSPWQRGTNENTNGLLRQYLPKKSDLSIYNQRQLDAIAKSLNTRPRKALGFMAPCEAFAEAVAATA